MKVSIDKIPQFENELIEYINENANLIPSRPAGFGITTKEYCHARGVAFTTARRVLEKLVNDGKLKVYSMKEKGHLVTVYNK